MTHDDRTSSGHYHRVAFLTGQRALVRSSILVATAALILGGCQPSYSPNQYDAVAMQQANKV
ncbi:MAG: hypothetical protein ACREF3_13615, partial [Acetobacteraceae bacterium]